MSYASSAGRHGLTSGQDVLRRVEVPVVPGAAGRARPVPRAKAQLREQVPARRAGLGGRVPAVDHDQVPAVPLALVLKLAAELAPPAVADRAGQPPVADHAGRRSGPRSRSCPPSGPGGCWRGAGSPAGRRGPCGGRGPPSPRPWPGSPSLSGSGPGAAGSGPGCGPCAPGAAGWRSSPRPRSRRSPSRPGRRRPRARSAASGSGAPVSTAKVTYQRPSGSRETTTIVGSSAATSTSGQDQVNRSGPPSWPAAAPRRAW